jgi:hypothetical protein
LASGIKITTLTEGAVLQRIFGHRKEEVITGCSKVSNEVFHNLHFLPNQNYEMGRTFGMHASEGKCIHSFGEKTWTDTSCKIWTQT